MTVYYFMYLGARQANRRLYEYVRTGRSVGMVFGVGRNQDIRKSRQHCKRFTR